MKILFSVLPGDSVQTDTQIDESIRELAGITHHPVDTCAMGIGPNAVVDPRLRVYGVAGLRVADASVMPVITGANTNAATVMIAEKAADLILGKWQANYIGLARQASTRSMQCMDTNCFVAPPKPPKIDT